MMREPQAASTGAGGVVAGEREPGAVPERRSPIWLVLQAAAVAVVFALLALLVWKVVAGDSGGAFVASIKAGKSPPAPAFTLPVIWRRDETWPRALRAKLADGQVSLDELRGHPVVINFWASWCIPCKEEAPYLAAAARRHRGNVAFLGIDIQDFERDARRFLREVDAPYVSVRDKSSRTYTAYGLTGVPETYYVDRQGRVVAHAIGAVSLREVEEGISIALRGAG